MADDAKEMKNKAGTSPTNSNTNFPTSHSPSKGVQKSPVDPAYPVSSKISFTTEKLDAVTKLVAEEKIAKLKARDYVRGLEEANEKLLRDKNDLQHALDSAQKSVAAKDHTIQEADDNLHQLENRLARERDQKDRDREELKLSLDDARQKDNECQGLRNEKESLEKKCDKLEKDLDGEKDNTQKLKNDISTMNGELAKAKEDANAKNKAFNSLVNDLNKALPPGSKTDLHHRPPRSLTLDSPKETANAIQNIKDKIKDLNKKLEEQGKENENLKNDNNNLKAILEDINADQAKKDEHLQQKLDDANNHHRDLEDQIGALKRQVKDGQEAAEKVKNLTESVPALKAEKENAVQELKAEQRNGKNLDRRIKDLEAENTRLRCEVARLRDCLRVTRRQQEKAETKVHELHKELQIGRATLDQCRLTPSCSRTGSADKFSNTKPE